LSPRIPNYNLEKCHNEDPLFQRAATVTLVSSLKSLTFRLWDEPHRRLVGYSYLRTLRRRQGCEGFLNDSLRPRDSG
jgi:omega-6 fatty acid desaturase (delta-12 desaturase)